MKPTNAVKKTRFIDRVSVYGLEFAVAMVTLVIAASVLSFATYALCNYLAYDSVGTGRGYFALWSSASTIVWVPVALLFYLRSRAYIAQHPEVTSHSVQRVFTIIFQVVMILTIISFSVAAVYAALMSLVKPDETGQMLLGVALPSAISALLFGGALVSFFRQPVVRRRTFAIVFSIVALAIVIPTIIVSVVSLRAVNEDQTKETDLYAIKMAVEDYERENDKTPATLSDVTSHLADDAVERRLNQYSYKRIDDNRYQLCADFTASSSYRASSSRPELTTDSYQSYTSFNEHDKGRNCFKLRTSYSSIYDRLESDSQR